MKLQEDYRVTFPLAVDGLQGIDQYAGYINVDIINDGQMFFWLFNTTQDTLVVWLNGGPGCSSMDGLLLEYGPLRILQNDTVIHNDAFLSSVSWVFIDQPVATGYSYVNVEGILHTIDQAAKEMKIFFRKFQKLFQYKHVYIAGESFAGAYIPYFARELADIIDIHGIMIGNGWIDPKPQYLSFIEYTLRKNLIPFKSNDERQKYLNSAYVQQKNCEEHLKKEVINTVDACDAIVGTLHDAYRSYMRDKVDKSFDTFFNQYYIVQQDKSRGNAWPDNLEAMTRLMNDKNIQRSLNVGNFDGTWKEINGAVYGYMSADKTRPAIELLPSLAEKGVNVLIFAGEMDLVSNYVGLEWALGNLSWGGQRGFTENYMEDFDKKIVVKARDGIALALILNGSHMLGVDKPKLISDLFQQFIFNDFKMLSGTSQTAPPSASMNSTFSIISVMMLLFLVLGLVGFLVQMRNNRRYRLIGREHREEAVDNIELDNVNRVNRSNHLYSLDDNSSVTSYDE